MNSLALYKKGTVFTALEIINNGSSYWAKTPSGYICLKDLNATYVKNYKFIYQYFLHQIIL